MQGLDTHEPEKVSAQSQDEPVQESRQRMEGQEADTTVAGGVAWDNVTDILSSHSPLRRPRHGRTCVQASGKVSPKRASHGRFRRWWNILKSLGEDKKDRILVGFAAETGNLVNELQREA